MRANDILAEGFRRIHELVHRATEGLDHAGLVHRVEPGANSIAWLVWHLARIQDSHLSEVAGLAELWDDRAWAARTGIDREPGTKGQEDGPDEVGAVRPPGPDGLLAYFDEVMRRSFACIESLTDADLDRVIDEAYDPPVVVGVRLVSVLSDNLQHAGQALYVRGIIDRTGA
jgi:hypothetical protein